MSSQLPDDELTFDPLRDVVDRASAPSVEHVPIRWWNQGPSWNRVLLGVVAALAVYFFVTLAQVVMAGRSDHREPVDAIVVLGAAQYDGRPSPQLAARLDHVVVLWEEGVAPLVVVTGGKLPADRFTEAEASQRYLIAQGVPESAIVAESDGTTTFESLDGVAPLLLARRMEEVVLVTDPYHAYRSQLIAREVGLDARLSPTQTSVVTGWTSARRHIEEAAGVALGRLVGFDRLSGLAG